MSAEVERLALQIAQDEAKTAAERNRLGQFATPGPLAADLLRCARALLGDDPSRGDDAIRFLDPAIGTGAFFSALLHECAGQRLEAATGFEIDPHYGTPSAALWQATLLDMRLEDFTAARPPRLESERFNLVICNPPYVRHHHLRAAEKARLRLQSQHLTGLKLSGLAGLYCHFMLLAHPWMQQGALAGWLIPSEFMDVNYGREIKRYLLNTVTLLRVHRFDPADVQFGDALVSSAVVWFRNERPTPAHQVEFTLGGTLNEPRIRTRISLDALDAEAKWTRLPTAVSVASTSDTTSRLGDFFEIRRGIATGANEFFVMTEAQANERGIPQQFLKPILPGARYLVTDEIEADERGLPLLDRRLFLLDCRLPEAEIRSRYSRLWEYLESGSQTVATGYLCSRRSPWYAQEQREAPWFLCTYIARSKKDGRTQRFLFNRSRAIAANTYLMLYPRAPLAEWIGNEVERARTVWEQLSRIQADEFTAEGRVYGGGMHKVEPRELANIPCTGSWSPRP